MNINDTLLKIEINPNEVCNRSCSFCPRSAGYPSTKDVITIQTAQKINQRLLEADYRQEINICGFGEPLLHKQIVEVVSVIGKDLNCKVFSFYTNGDYLTADIAKQLIDAGITRFYISMYDENREDYFRALIPKDTEVRFNHYYDHNDYWVNRNEIFNNSDIIAVDRTCWIPFYKAVIDWDGSMLLCTNDWNKTQTGGNVYDNSLEEMWYSETLDLYRKMLYAGKRTMSPCNKCDVYGMREGHVWDPSSKDKATV